MARQAVKDIAAFMKFRLTLLVVISSGIGYGIGAEEFSWIQFIIISLAGFLVAGASNGFNQIIERDLDALMMRTRNRPVVTGQLGAVSGMVLASVSALLGLALLYFAVNTLSAILGALALFSYVLVYTPLKRITPLSTFAGAFPGAIPPMLGYVAATGKFDLYAGLLFATQFIWQFPHFWAIAWVLHDDYQKAGFFMMPTPSGRSRQSAFIILLYTLFLVPTTMLPWVFELTGIISAVASAVLGLAFAIPAIQLYRNLSMQAARQLMFASFFYLPLLQLVYLLDTL